MYSWLLKGWFLGGCFVLIGTLNDQPNLIVIGCLLSIPLVVTVVWFLKEEKVPLVTILRNGAILVSISSTLVMGSLGAFVLFAMVWCLPSYLGLIGDSYLTYKIRESSMYEFGWLQVTSVMCFLLSITVWRLREKLQFFGIDSPKKK